jgi:hypothetical protein
MKDRRELETQESERRMVGLGRREASDITLLIIVMLIAGFVMGLPGGILL